MSFASLSLFIPLGVASFRDSGVARASEVSRRTERIVLITTKYYHGQDGRRVVIRAALPIARGQHIHFALARAGRHDFLAAAVTATLATAALAANVALSVTIVLPQDSQHPVLGDRL